mmetsp:Transcript_27087/g.45370  ORF Transcript_27087/g.45370 Transcript_27087/m.45370 type:complete len:386 (+) Transcript_27087:74-1231(+)
MKTCQVLVGLTICLIAVALDVMNDQLRENVVSEQRRLLSRTEQLRLKEKSYQLRMKESEELLNICIPLDEHLVKYLHDKLGQNIYDYPQCNVINYIRDRIKFALNTSTSFVLGKIGGTEYAVLNYLAGKKSHLSNAPHTNSGIYPMTADLLNEWNVEYSKGLQSMDVTVPHQDEMGILRGLYNSSLPVILSTTSAKIGNEEMKKTMYSIFWPWYWNQPYTELFANKTVLVVSPFSKYIQAQYHTNRTCIFPHQPNVLPEFKQLITIDAPLPPVLDGDYTKLSTYLNAGINSSFVSNLAELKRQVAAIEYDVMLVGAGSLALPLAAAEKPRGKVIIHIGGNLGPLFGLKGGRFDMRKEYKHYFYNPCWLRMDPPPAAARMESSAYW